MGPACPFGARSGPEGGKRISFCTKWARGLVAMLERATTHDNSLTMEVDGRRFCRNPLPKVRSRSPVQKLNPKQQPKNSKHQ